MKHALKVFQGQGTLQQCLNSLMLSYRNTPHATTKASPASLLKKRALLKGGSAKSIGQIKHYEQRAEILILETVFAKNYLDGQKWVPATVIAPTGPVFYTVQTAEDVIWKRHTDQLKLSNATPTEPPVVSGPELLLGDTLTQQ